MFKENIEIIKNTFQEFIGQGMYILLFLIALLYIYVKEDNKKNKAFLLYGSIIILFITLNPIFNKVVGKIFTSSVYWRVFWMLPFGITIAYAGVKFINTEKEKYKQIVAMIGLILIVIVSGKLVYNEENYFKLGNLYKLPDEDVLVTQLIGADDEEYKKVIAPESLVAHMRQVDASMDLAYRRDPQGNGNPTLTALMSGNVEELIKNAKIKNCNYIVFRKETVLNGNMEDYNFEKFDETDNYIIYKLVNK